MATAPADHPDWDLFGEPPVLEKTTPIYSLPDMYCTVGTIGTVTDDILQKFGLSSCDIRSLDPVYVKETATMKAFDMIIIGNQNDSIQGDITLHEFLCHLVRDAGSVFSSNESKMDQLEENPFMWKWKETPYAHYTRTNITANLSSSSSYHNTINTTQEQETLNKITICLSKNEKKTQKLTRTKQMKAVKALQEQGICILRGVFSTENIKLWKEASIEDSLESLEELKRKDNDPRQLQLEEEFVFSDDNNDVIRAHSDKMTICLGKKMKELAQNEEQSNALRYHPAILSILVESSLDPKQHVNPTRFDKTMLRRSETVLEAEPVGAVLSLPGAGKTVDQLIHVDTEHLYEHIHLPPHYLAMFVPTMEEPSEIVGQTAFVVGSHRSSVAQKFTQKGPTHTQLNRYRDGLIRPQCSSGDAILFDARILHFGIANSSQDVIRSILFINYHRPWFQDVQRGSEMIIRFR